MMKGALAAQDVRASECRVAQSLQGIAPYPAHQRRQNTLRQVNPVRYHARYFGHKIHMDQNEKLIMYGVTYVVARDGYSGKIVASAVMPRKNNITIYENIYRLVQQHDTLCILCMLHCSWSSRAAVQKHGLWQQVRVDHGREFYLNALHSGIIESCSGRSVY